MNNFLITLLTILISVSGYANKTKVENKKVKEVVLKLSSKGNDIQFETKYIQLKLSAFPVKITFANRADKDSEIIHNIVFIKPGKEVKKRFITFLQKTDYNTNKFSKHKDVIAYTKQIVPGEETSIELNIKKPGMYNFICTMPGHGDMLDMSGILNVVK